MNPRAKSIQAAGSDAFPFNSKQQLTLPEDSTQRVAVTAAAMCAMIHHAAAVGPNLAAMAGSFRDNSVSTARYLWGVLKDTQLKKPDPPGVELLRSPEQSAQEIHDSGRFPGDCDDVAMLACAIAMRLGWPCGLRVIRREGNDWEHVYAVVYPLSQGPECVIDPQETGSPFDERPHVAALNFPVWRA